MVSYKWTSTKRNHFFSQRLHACTFRAQQISSPADTCSTSGTTLTGHLFCFHTFVAVRDERPYGNADLRSGFLGALMEAIFFPASSQPADSALHVTSCLVCDKRCPRDVLPSTSDPLVRDDNRTARWDLHTQSFSNGDASAASGGQTGSRGTTLAPSGRQPSFGGRVNIPVSVPGRAWLGCASRNRANVVVLFFN
jgi:hypothetical protein